MANQSIKKSNGEEIKSFAIAQDVKFLKRLSANDSKIRDRAVKSLKKWLNVRSLKLPFTREDFLRIWKGLFNTMWMSDKPLVQEECAENIARLLHFPTPDVSLLFFECALIVMSLEWFGIDQLRLDKFFMLVRRLLRQAFEVLKQNNWDSKLIADFGNILLKTVLKPDNDTHLSLTMHITEIYLEEFAKISNGEIGEKVVLELVKPFIEQLSTLCDLRQISHVKKFLFHHLLRQSEKGIEYHEKFEAWKERGFPGGTIEAMEELEASEDEDIPDNSPGKFKALDPRAGHVDVLLPQLPFSPRDISKLLLENKFSEASTTKSRKIISKLAQEFEKLASGSFPLGIKEIRLPEKNGYSTALKKSVNRLVKFEKKILATSNSNNRKRKKSKRTLDIPKEATSTSSWFDSELQEFINESESKINQNGVKRRKVEVSTPDWQYVDNFRRNSGTWIVHQFSTDLSSASLQDSGDSKSSEIEKNNEISLPWDLPPKEGEVEIFVPSNKLKKKMGKDGSVNSYCTNLIINSLVKKKSNKTRYSLDMNIVRNSFATNGYSSNGEKKVKIDLKLNRSQEIHEHQEQIRSSPAIPYDANKKPSKPLLKPNAIKSPINPFYKKKLKLFK